MEKVTTQMTVKKSRDTISTTKTNGLSAMLQQVYSILTAHSTKILLVISILFVLISTLYSGWFANLATANNSDSLVYAYLFKDFQPGDALLPGNHANIIKFPLFFLQAFLPYNFASLAAVTLTLIVTTVIGWLLILIKLLGVRYAMILCVAMSSVALGSSWFTYLLSENVIRNIEYPIGLSFIALIAVIISGKFTKSKYHIIGAITIWFLFSLSISGDSLLIYAFNLPLLIIIFLGWTLSGTINRNYIKAALVVITSVVAGYILRYSVDWLNIVDLSNTSVSATSTVDLNALLPSIGTALVQLLDLMGANIFGKALNGGTVLAGVNLMIILTGLAGLLIAISKLLKSYNNNKLTSTVYAFTLASLGMSFIVTFFVYVILGMVLTKQQDGSLIDSGQIRYLSLLPFLLVAGFAFFVKAFFHKSVWVISSLIVVSIILALPSIKSHYSEISMSSQKTRETFVDISKSAKENDATVIVSGFWFGATTRFWSEKELEAVSVIGCNIPHPDFNIRRSWYKSDTTNQKTMVIIDRSGLDKSYWESCSSEQLIDLFGNPESIEAVESPNGLKPIQLWFYDKDLRKYINQP